MEDIFYTKNSKGISEALNTLYEEFQQREEDSDDINQPLFLFLFGLQNMDRILETFDGETDFDMEDPFALDDNDNCDSKNRQARYSGYCFRKAHSEIFLLWPGWTVPKVSKNWNLVTSNILEIRYSEK